MASKILLISVNQCDEPYPVFPLGLAYIDTALRRAGHQTRLTDWQMERPAIADLLQEFRPDIVGISLRNIDDVLIRKRLTFFDGLGSLCTEIKQCSSCPIILGGSGFSIFPEELLVSSGADFGIQGAGEDSMLSLVSALEQKMDYSNIAGLLFRDADRIVMNPRLDRTHPHRIAMPERPGNLVAFYLRTSTMLNVQTQRGCAHNCCYCTYPVIEGRQYQRRTPEAVAEEFEALRGLGAKYLFVVDAVFNSSNDHVAGVCEAIIKKDLKLKWGCFLHPKNLTPELMRLMARAGLTHIEFGSDSFCDSVLEAYGKDFTFDDIFESSELARRERVDYCHFLIFGGPGETRDTMELSFENSRRFRNAVILAVAGMRIYPGTPLYELARHEGFAGTGADLLQPQYYLSPSMSENVVFSHLNEFARRSHAWIVGDPTPLYRKLTERLRAKGVVGPLWNYFAMMRRLSDVSRERTAPMGLAGQQGSRHMKHANESGQGKKELFELQ
jgi:radical SAM superfamily enzyme YgiQ (UPF0313 family)